MKQFMNKVKTRWNLAPTWVKMVDIGCWFTLVLLAAYFW